MSPERPRYPSVAIVVKGDHLYFFSTVLRNGMGRRQFEVRLDREDASAEAIETAVDHCLAENIELTDEEVGARHSLEALQDFDDTKTERLLRAPGAKDVRAFYRRTHGIAVMREAPTTYRITEEGRGGDYVLRGRIIDPQPGDLGRAILDLVG